MAERDFVADAEVLKAQGNKYLASKDFDQAISSYSEAIKLNPNSHVYFSNRSAAYLSKTFAGNALKDADTCISIKPDWAKGYSRKGAALHKLKKYSESVEAYEAGLVVDPNNAALKLGLAEVNQAQEQAEPAVKTTSDNVKVDGSDDNAQQSQDGKVTSDGDEVTKNSDSVEADTKSVVAEEQPKESLDGKVTSDEQTNQSADAEVTTVSEEVKKQASRDELRKKLRAKMASSRRSGGSNNKTHVVTQQQDRVAGFRQQGEHGAKMRIKP